MGRICLVCSFLGFELMISILVFPEQVKSQECLSVQLWDSDRITADDIVGKIEFDLHDLILNGGKMESRVDKLAGDKNGSKMPGELYWDVGYFPKASFNKDLETHGQDTRIPKQYLPILAVCRPLTSDFGTNLSSKIPLGNWLLKQRLMPSTFHLTQRILRGLFPSLSTRSSISRLRILQGIMLTTVSSLLGKNVGRIKRRRASTYRARIVQSC